MSDLSTLSNNIELILEHKEEIQNYAPYKFCRIGIMHPSKQRKDWYTRHMYLGAYLDVWQKCLESSTTRTILPLYISVGQFGTVYKFLGLSLFDKNLVIEKQANRRSAGIMRDPMWKFIQANKDPNLTISLAQVVQELKEGKPQEQRESYQLFYL